MKKLLAGAITAGVVGSVGALGTGVSAADDETAYAVGGAKVPGIPWYQYTDLAGRGYYPNATRVIVDYPAGMLQGRLLEDVLPVGSSLNSPSVGESVATGTNNLDAAIRSNGGSGVAIGLSEGALVLNAEQARLAHDPTAPPPDQLSFSVFGDPAGSHGFGQSFLAAMFPPGTFVPVIDYTMPNPVESQYESTKVVAAYDGAADFPDRPNLVSALNALVGAGIVHTPVAFTSPANVPPRNIITTTNSRGGTTTTYLVPSKHLPLTLPFRYMGAPNELVDQIDEVLQPMVDAGFSRNDNVSSAPIGVDPVGGVDPLAVMEPMPGVDPFAALDPTTRANLDGFLKQAQGLLPPGIG